MPDAVKEIEGFTERVIHLRGGISTKNDSLGGRTHTPNVGHLENQDRIVVTLRSHSEDEEKAGRDVKENTAVEVSVETGR